MKKNSPPKGIDDWPTGVEPHGKGIRIWFMYKGERCREPLPQLTKVTASAVRYAETLRNDIVRDIKRGTFNYAKQFPDSDKAQLFTFGHTIDRSRTIAIGVERWLEVKRAQKAQSTVRNYAHKAAHLIEHFGDRRMIRETSKSDLELFQSGLLREKGLSPKTVNDIFTVVRGVWSDAFIDQIIDVDIALRIKNIETDNADSFADPFDRDELAKIAGTETDRPQDRNLCLFNSWCGLSISEVMGLAWEDIDQTNWTISVKRARVESVYKVPKEKTRIRTVELIDPAIAWLKEQMALTYMLPAIKIETIQRNNATKVNESIRLVFVNQYDEKRAEVIAFSPATALRRFTTLLAKAKVRHRGPNQCRHTFASQALSSYIPLEWVARQLGHSDTTMVKKHYGKWIPRDTKSMAKWVSETMGVSVATNGLENSDFAPILPQSIGKK